MRNDATTRIAALARAGKQPQAIAAVREECLAAGMDDCVTKPNRVDAVVEVLKQARMR